MTPHRHPARRMARIEIVPLIDVVFFLMATFVLLTLSLTKIHGIPVPLPRTGSESQVVKLTVVDDSGLRWNDEWISRAELPGRLARYREQTSDPRVFVTGSAEAAYGPVIQVLDTVRKTGISRVSIETRPPARARR